MKLDSEQYQKIGRAVVIGSGAVALVAVAWILIGLGQAGIGIAVGVAIAMTILRDPEKGWRWSQ